MTEMIERVAKAIAEASMQGWDEHMGSGAAAVLARAAINAMREPTPEIIAVHHVVPDDTDFAERARANWQALIDTALGVPS